MSPSACVCPTGISSWHNKFKLLCLLQAIQFTDFKYRLTKCQIWFTVEGKHENLTRFVLHASRQKFLSIRKPL